MQTLVVLFSQEIGGSSYECDGDIDEAAQNVPFSIVCGFIVSVAYHLSRSASDPGVLWYELFAYFMQSII